MIATGIMAGWVVNDLEIASKEEGRKTLSVLLKINKQNRQPAFYYLEAFNSDALRFKQKVRKGDYVSVVFEPYSNLKDETKKTKDQYFQGYKIILFEVQKRGEIK